MSLTHRGVARRRVRLGVIGWGGTIHHGLIFGGPRCGGSHLGNHPRHIAAQRHANLGDGEMVPAALDGFTSDGTIITGAEFLEILNANEAVLVSLRLGNKSGLWAKIAYNSLLLGFGKNVTEFGTINTPNNPTKPLINNGLIGGNLVSEPMTLIGYVKGVGIFAHVVINGTLAPCLSMGVVDIDGDLVLGDAAVLQIELTGLTAQSERYRVAGAGAPHAAGTFQVVLLNDYVPS